MSSRRKASVPERRTPSQAAAEDYLLDEIDDGPTVPGAAAPPASVPTAATEASSQVFLDAVRTRFESRPEVYSDFVAVMKEFKAGSLVVAAVVRRVARLFRQGNRDLMLLFNEFLPAHSRVTDADLVNPSHPAYLLRPDTRDPPVRVCSAGLLSDRLRAPTAASSYTAPRTKRIGENDGPVVVQVPAKRQKTERLPAPIQLEELKRQPVYSLIYPDASRAAEAQTVAPAASAWSVEEVASWVSRQTLDGDELDFEDVASKFRSEEVTGHTLLAYAESGRKELKEDFQLTIGKSSVLWRAICALAQEESTAGRQVANVPLVSGPCVDVATQGVDQGAPAAPPAKEIRSGAAAAAAAAVGMGMGAAAPAGAAAAAAAPSAADDPPTGELPRLLLPGDRVMVDMNDPSVHTDTELQGSAPDHRQPELGRNRDPDLQQFLLDHVMAERFSRRGGARSRREPTAASAAKLAATGPKWEACVVLGCSRDMLALNTTSGDKIYVLNSALATTSTKAFNDTTTIFSCQGCASRMRVPRPCDVLICFKCKTKVSPPPPSQRGAGTSFNTSGYGGSRLAQSHTSDRTDLPLRTIPPMSKGDFIGMLQVGDEVEIQVVYKCAHRVAARAWVMAKVVGRKKWNGSADVLQLMVPYPAPSNNARAGPGGYPPGRGGHFPGGGPMPGEFLPRRVGRGDLAGATGGAGGAAAVAGATLELPAGNRFGSATVELPSLDALPDLDRMPDPVPILVTTDATPLCERAAACQKIARTQPNELAEMHIMVSDPPAPPGIPGSNTATDRTTMMRVRSMRTAVILSHVPGLQRHVVAYSEQEVKLLDLKTACFVVEPATERLYHASVLGKPGTHIKDCPVCYEPFDWSSLGRPSMSCHPRECCTKCLTTWAEGQIGEGKLYVRCPAEGCKKQLALNQVKQIVNRTKYNSFVNAIREVHREAARAEEEEDARTEEEQKAFLEFVTQQDVRFCIGCFARIEKNKGCSHMTCWRCGTEFQWETAPPVSAGLPEAQAAAQKAQLAAGASGGGFDAGRRLPMPARRANPPGHARRMAFNPLAYISDDEDEDMRWGASHRPMRPSAGGPAVRKIPARPRAPIPQRGPGSTAWVSNETAAAPVPRKRDSPETSPPQSIEEGPEATAGGTGSKAPSTRNRSARGAAGPAAAAAAEDPFSPAAAAEQPRKRLRSKNDLFAPIAAAAAAPAAAGAQPAAPVRVTRQQAAALRKAEAAAQQMITL